MDKMGQILRTLKWLRSQSEMPLQAERLPAADIFLRYLCHFDAAKVDLERFSSRLNRKGIPIGRDF
jgi:hypothetical protein